MGIQWSDAEDLPKCIIESSREVLNLAPSAIDESHAGPLATNSKDTTTKKIRGNSDDTMDHLSDDDSPAPSFKVRSRSVVEKAPVAVATETDKNENKEFEKASSCEKTGASRKASEKTKSNVFDPMELLFEEDAKPAKKLSVHGRTTTVSAKAPEASKSVSNTVKSKPKQKAEDLLDFLMDDDLDNSAATTKKSIPSSVTVAVQKESAPSRTLSKSMRNKNSSTADFFDSLLEDNDVQSQAPSVVWTVYIGINGGSLTMLIDGYK